MSAADLHIRPVGIWTSSSAWQAAGEEREDAAAELDELGFCALWLGSSDGQLELPQALLAATARLIVATGIVSIWTNPAAIVASSYRRVDAAHPDRLLVGLGASHERLVAAHQYRQPLHRLGLYLDELDALEPRVPVNRRVLAALGPKALTLAAERSAGAHPYLVTPEHTQLARGIMGPTALLAPEQKVVLEADPSTARAIARKTLGLYLQLPNYTNNLLRLGFTTDDFDSGGSDLLVDSLIAWGDSDAVARRIADHHAAGADHVCIQVLTSADRHHGSLPRQEWRLLADALSIARPTTPGRGATGL